MLFKKCGNNTSATPAKPIKSEEVVKTESIDLDQKVHNSNEITDENIAKKPVVEKLTECVIIVGAYESPKNALKMSDKISKLGYTPYQEYFDTMGVTRVGFKFSCGEEDLEAFIHKVRNQIDKNAWYLVPRITVE